MQGDGEAERAAFDRLTAFIEALKSAPTLTEIETILAEATHAHGFDHFALLQRLSRRNSVGPIQLTDFPEDWIAEMLTRERYRDDPVLEASERSVASFVWRDLPSLLPISRRHREYMRSAREMGLGEGYTVPIHVPGEASGLCSFVTGHNSSFPESSLPAMHYLACFAFESARRLAPRPDGGDAPPKLTQRQLDCVVLAAKGKSNWVVGELLGIRQTTVHKYMESAKRRYGVGSRTELVVRALFDGQISFKDVVH